MNMYTKCLVLAVVFLCGAWIAPAYADKEKKPCPLDKVDPILNQIKAEIAAAKSDMAMDKKLHPQMQLKAVMSIKGDAKTFAPLLAEFSKRGIPTGGHPQLKDTMYFAVGSRDLKWLQKTLTEQGVDNLKFETSFDKDNMMNDPYFTMIYGNKEGRIAAAIQQVPSVPTANQTRTTKEATLPETEAGWKGLTPKERLKFLDMIDSAEAKKSGVKVEDYSVKDWSTKLSDPVADQMLKALKQKIGDTVDIGNQTDGAASVGTPEVELKLAKLKDGTVIGARVQLFQRGAFLEDGSNEHFKTAAEAEKAGFDTSADVRWDISVIVDPKGKVLSGDTYWDWSGW